MKKALLLLPFLLLLVSCGANRETCALAASRQITSEEAAKRLGLKEGEEAEMHAMSIADVVSSYCEYYKN